MNWRDLKARYDCTGSSGSSRGIGPEGQETEATRLARPEDTALLASLPNLENLRFRGTLVDDLMIELISQLTFLKAVIFMGTSVSEEGVKTLRRALPNCRVQEF